MKPNRQNCSIICLAAICAVAAIVGCSRASFRQRADQDAYRLIESRQFDWRWELPWRQVEPSPESRLADTNSADCPPLPPDDPAAAGYMRRVYNSRPTKYWDRLPRSAAIDSEHWVSQLPFDENGKVKITKERSIDLALVHNREFQSRVEALYNAALGLSANRFDFELNWFGGAGSGFLGGPGDSNRSGNAATSLGFNRSLAIGGQVAANFANSFIWQFGGGQNDFATGGIVLSLTQPLLRGAFRHIRTESLTQSERSLLYAVRDFARFRRQFYFSIVSQYYFLLNQVQAIKIEKENVQNLRQNLEEFEEQLEQGQVSPIQRDQVFQSYQNARQAIFNAEQGLEASLDQFRFQLGLPSRIPMELDQSVLEPFRLNSKDIEALQNDVKELEKSLAEYLPPDVAPPEFYTNTLAELRKTIGKLDEQLPLVLGELKKWEAKIEAFPEQLESEDDRVDFEQQSRLAKRIREFLEEVQRDKKQLKLKVDEVANAIQSEVAPEGESEEERVIRENEKWKRVQRLVGQELRRQVAAVFVSQTQIRLFLIELKPVKIDSETAVKIALTNRLDLMNERARVTDSFRQVEIAANQLKSDLSVSAAANLNTDGAIDNGFRLDGEASQYQLGVQFDGPLNRFVERNQFRGAQIAYQQARRQYMAAEDAIVNQIRADIRQLQQSKFSFGLTRQSLIAAVRQVEQAQLNLSQGTGGDSSSTQDLLQALQGLRQAQNGLISSWVTYEISRINLFVDLELLNLDERGIWINEQDDITQRLDFEDRSAGGTDRTDTADVEKGANRTVRPSSENR